MRALAILLLIAGCAAPQPSLPPTELLDACQDRTVPPPAPPPPRTAPVLAKWSIQLQLAREATDRALADCSRRHGELAEWTKANR